MRPISRVAAVVLALFACLTLPSTAARSQVAAAKPTNATGQCKDGTYSTAQEKSVACRGHNGVKDWYAAMPAPKSETPSTPTVLTAKPISQPATNNPQPTTAFRKGPKANLASTPAAPGGAPNLVWLNSSSNVYHCYGTDFYGKTKAGAYMTETDAKTKGAHGNRGATCAK